MGSRNESGLKLQCSHCGYVWFYTGERSVTSCPNCGWRVRARASTRLNIPASDSLVTERRNERLI